MTDTSALEARIDEILARHKRAIVAIDGMAASGKTTLSRALAANYTGSFIVHMDDFTMPFENRYPGYFEASLSNADIRRFDREVLTPLLGGQAARYRPYVCHPQPGFLAPVTIPADFRLLLVEGAYCLHPTLFDRYDLRVLLLISKATQRERILTRNGPEQLERFLSMWIPMEHAHIGAHQLRETCDMILSGT